MTVRLSKRLTFMVGPREAPYGKSKSVASQAAKLKGLLQSAAAAIVIIDQAGTIENINPATERMFG